MGMKSLRRSTSTMPILSGNIILLTFLYFIQGLPYGFQVQFLPVYLRSRGVDLTHVGFMKLLHMPWLCKTLWAPFVDKFGTKRKWLIGSVLGLIVTCIYGGFIPPENLVLLCSVLFLLNIFASTQDIAVDSIAVAILSQKELGHGNTAQVVGYKIGSIFGGGLLVWFMNFLGWTGLFLVMSVLYLEALLFVFVSPVLRNFEKRYGVEVQHSDSSDTDSDVFDDEDTDYDDEEEEDGEEEEEGEETGLGSEEPDEEGSVSTNRSESLPDLIEQPSPSQDKSYTQGNNTPDILSDNIPLDSLKTKQSKDKNVIYEDLDSKNESDCNNSDIEVSSSKSNEFSSSPSQQDTASHTKMSHTSVDSIEHIGVSSKNTSPDTAKKRIGKSILDEPDFEEEEEDDDSHSYCGPELSQEEIDNLQSAAEYVHEESQAELAIDVSSGPRKLVSDVVNTPGTRWMVFYVLMYKLGEQGALGMMPLFLVDHGVDPADVTFWTGLVGQGISIIGSILGGMCVAKYGIPVCLFLKQLSLLRLTPLGIQVLLIGAWAYEIFIIDESFYLYIAIGSMFVLLLISGIVTTVTFTFMMQCSKMAPVSVQATHYSTLATCEVFGKLAFTAVTGWLADNLGYPVLFLIFVTLAGVVLLLFKFCPDDLNDDVDEDSQSAKLKTD